MKTYLITGVAGFIAARVAEMLLDVGHAVTGIDNLNDAYDVRMKEYRLRQLQERENFEFIWLDISDWEALLQSPVSDLQFSAVINLAARAGVRASIEDPWVYVDTNMTGTLNLLEFSRRAGIPKFILASTSSIYGLNAPLPTP